MTPQTKLVVEHATGQYPIFIDQQWQLVMAREIARHYPRCLVISDELVACRYADTLRDAFRDAGLEFNLLTVPPGESSKSPEVALRLYNQLLAEGVDRQSTLIALGGGVVGDLTGFLAATWMRGIDFVQIPTTLLAQVDSSVGGKTGVNLPTAKNVIGAFWQPQAVFIDTAVLKTLPAEEYTSGLAEVVKYGVILDQDLFATLERQAEPVKQRDSLVLVEIVHRCCQLKAQVVRCDERETTGHRAILNYGHTFGHAIESVLGFGSVPHGHAVAMGMTAAGWLARALDMVDDNFVAQQQNLLRALGIPAQFPAERHDEFIDVMRSDKKALAGRPRFVLPTKIGHVELIDNIDPRLVRQAMRQAAGGES